VFAAVRGVQLDERNLRETRRENVAWHLNRGLRYNVQSFCKYWEADSLSASQEIPRLLWNPRVHYRVNNSPPLVRIQSVP
jgi:hypothetical protein